jgi:hypothetical protein
MQQMVIELSDDNRGLKAKLEENDRIAQLEKHVFHDDGVAWFRRDDGNIEPEPYCPTCWDDKRKLVHLTPGASQGTYSCALHGISYWTRTFRSKSWQD